MRLHLFSSVQIFILNIWKLAAPEKMVTVFSRSKQIWPWIRALPVLKTCARWHFWDLFFALSYFMALSGININDKETLCLFESSCYHINSVVPLQKEEVKQQASSVFFDLVPINEQIGLYIVFFRKLIWSFSLFVSWLTFGSSSCQVDPLQTP